MRNSLYQCFLTIMCISLLSANSLNFLLLPLLLRKCLLKGTTLCDITKEHDTSPMIGDNALWDCTTVSPS